MMDGFASAAPQHPGNRGRQSPASFRTPVLAMTSKQHPRPKLRTERSLDGYGPWKRLVRDLFLRRLILFFFFLLGGRTVVHRILPLRTFQLNSDRSGGLINLVILAEGLKSMRQHLHSQLSVGHALEAGPAFRVDLQMVTTFGLLTALVH